MLLSIASVAAGLLFAAVFAVVMLAPLVMLVLSLR